MRRGRAWMAMALGWSWACAAVEPDVDDGDAEASTGDDGTETGAAEATAGQEGPGPTSATEEGESSEGGEEDSTGCSFIGCDETGDVCGSGGAACECDVWGQDCQEGEKCNPWANDGSNAWNATRCVPISENPGEPGDECEVEGTGVSGFDTCKEGAMCWDVDEEGNGTCVAFCSGSEASPICEDPQTSCTIANDGVLILCLPTCDPLMSSCEEGSACYPSDDTFVCVFDSSGEAGAYGDPCEFTNACDPGLYCAPAGGVPDCTTANCCTPFCDMSADDADTSCPGAAGGQQCVPWYEEGQVPPGFMDLGACLLPD